MAKSFNAPEGCTRLTINLPTDLHTKVKMAAILNKTTVGDLVSKFIQHELEIILKIK